ncbi:MAG: outer membrane lipid asymmetry maintenance protein MlaD [Lysobacteraceae bacterium]
MSASNKPRTEIAVGLFLLLSFLVLLALAFASTNGRLPFTGQTYSLTASFSNIGELKLRAPVRIGGVTIGEVARIELDPVSFDAVVTLRIDSRFNELPADSAAGVFTAGLLGERYVGISPGGDIDVLADGDEIFLVQSAVVLEDLIAKFIFDAAPSGGSGSNDSDDSDDDDLLDP